MAQARDAQAIWLLAATFVVAVAGLVYELIAGAVSSYLLGDSVTQFSLVIGVFMTSMGLGAWASRFVTVPEHGFTLSQVLLGIVGGFSAPILFLSYGYLDGLHVILFSLVIAIGALSGLEIPLITRTLTEREAMKHTLSSVLTADYAGALVAAVLFPLVIVPQLGLMAASLTFGLLNLVVAGISVWLFRDRIGWALRGAWVFGLAACLAGLIWSDRIVSLADHAFFEDDVILSEETPYQRIVVTHYRDRYRLFLNGSIQFDTLDEHRYHESLVHPVMARAPRRAEVLILGGGDGMAAREVLKWTDVERVTLVDLDPAMTELGRLDGGLHQQLPGFEVRQVNYSLLEPLAIKAFHLHRRQTDVWFVPPADKLLVVLADVRKGSPSEGQVQRLVLGDGNSRLLRIPPGVAHGCRNLRPTAPGTIVYMVDVQFSTDEHCDEGRLAWDFFGAAVWEVERG